MNLFLPRIIIVLLLLYAGFIGFSSYGMYTFLRIIVCLVTGLSAYNYFVNNSRLFVWVWVIIAILFNPIIKVHFSRSNWESIDIVVALIVSLISFLEYRQIIRLKNS